MIIPVLLVLEVVVAIVDGTLIARRSVSKSLRNVVLVALRRTYKI